MSTRNRTSSSTTTRPHSLISFFDPTTQGTDSRGRTIRQILSWPDSELEACHDYIQTLFPLPEESMFNFSVAVITPEVYSAFRERAELRDSLREAWGRLAGFYGLEIHVASSGTTSSGPSFEDDGHDGAKDVVRLIRGPNWERSKKRWVTRFNHNHLRLTRIIRSLRVLALPEHAVALNAFLQSDKEVVAITSARSRMFWRRAAERALWLPPDADDEGDEGIEWLRKE